MIQASPTINLSAVRRLTFEAYRRAEAMGLVEPASPTEEFEQRNICAGLCSEFSWPKERFTFPATAIEWRSPAEVESEAGHSND